MKPEPVTPEEHLITTAVPIESDISIAEWVEAERELGFQQPPESVTVAQYADLRHFKGSKNSRRQKAYRVLESLVERKRAVRLDTKPRCYRLRTPGDPVRFPQ